MNQSITITPKLQARFWAKVDVRSPEECWPWMASCSHGYGDFRINRRTFRANRLAYQFCIGSIPDGLIVCHRCNNRACVNPAHLYAGTYRDNSHDAVVAGTASQPPHYLGSKHHAAKLSEAQVIEIRQRAAQGMRFRDLAKLYGVDRCTIGDLVYRRTWTHV